MEDAHGVDIRIYFNNAKMELCSNRAANPELAFELYYEQINNL